MMKRRNLDDSEDDAISQKLLKSNENDTISTASKPIYDIKGLTLSTQSFYGNKNNTVREKSVYILNDAHLKRNPKDVPKKHSLSSTENIRRHSLSKLLKKTRINMHVSHGIKKPKPKNNHNHSKIVLHTTDSTNVPLVNSLEEQQKENVTPTKENTLSNNEDESSDEIDDKKQIFKRKPKLGKHATVTINDKIKLSVTNGKMALNRKVSKKHVKIQRSTPSLSSQIVPDTINLTVDEPEVEAAVEKSNVPNILKLLEEDWSDDIDDNSDINKSLVDFGDKDTSLLLHRDGSVSPEIQLNCSISINNSNNKSFEGTPLETNEIIDESINKEVTEKRYYPIFAKGYVHNDINEQKTPSKITKNIDRLSIKGSKGDYQYQLDAGQKRFGPTQCPECNLVYQLGEPEDENAHLNYHNSINTLKFNGWKTERVIVEDTCTSSRIILVEPNDSKQCWKRVLSILAVVDRDLGLVDVLSMDFSNKKVYLYIRGTNILGVLIAEPIKSAYRMIPELIELDCCTAESTPAKCGINVVWTVFSHRKQGIASKLVDVLRTNFYYGFILTMDDIAFSIPTPSGKLFAEKYTRSRNFKIRRTSVTLNFPPLKCKK